MRQTHRELGRVMSLFDIGPMIVNADTLFFEFKACRSVREVSESSESPQ
jgi:hypothetical protein